MVTLAELEVRVAELEKQVASHMTHYPEQFNDWPEFLGTADVARVLRINRSTAIRLMKQDGFPLLIPDARRNMRVNKYRFLDWLRGGSS